MGLPRLIFRGIAAVVAVLLVVLLGLLLDVLLLVPGLLFAYTLTGMAWHWSGWVPSPVQLPGPWMAMALGLLASLVPAVADYGLLRLLRLP